MAGRVESTSLGPCRAWVDARRHPRLFSCARPELREHTLWFRRHHLHAVCGRFLLAHPGPVCVLPPIPAKPGLQTEPTLDFARYLEKQNLEAPAPGPGHPPARPSIEPAPALTRKDVPRLGDVAPVPQTPAEVRLRVMYRINAPLQPGRMIDVLV